MQPKALKEFAMNCLLIENSLQEIETRFNLEIGKGKRVLKEKNPAYYLQFNEDVRNLAADMSVHYEVLFCLERSIRDNLSERLEEEYGRNWWDNENAVPPKIKDEVERRIQEEDDQNLTPRSERRIDYTSFGDLKDIIFLNWHVFNDMFRSKNATGRVFNELNLLRNLVAHSCPLAEDEEERLAFTIKSWFKLME